MSLRSYVRYIEVFCVVLQNKKVLRERVYNTDAEPMVYLLPTSLLHCQDKFVIFDEVQEAFLV